MDNMRLCFEVLALASAIDRACAARLAPYRLSEGKFVLLFLLRDLPEGLAPHELAERAGVTRATITGLLDGLERDGFLARHDDKEDRRSWRRCRLRKDPAFFYGISKSEIIKNSGLFRRDYEGTTLRERMGLAKPKNQFFD